jgi:hypothetical protein
MQFKGSDYETGNIGDSRFHCLYLARLRHFAPAISGETQPAVPRPYHRHRRRVNSGAAKIKQAGAGIEPANSGFADRDLTTWLPRQHASSERNALS